MTTDILPKATWRLGLLLGIIFAAIVITINKKPLDGVHWDSPIYLYQAKMFAETNFLRHYSIHANEIATQVDGNWPKGERFSKAYWRFSRFGHIAILGSILLFFKNGVNALLAGVYFYHILLLLGLFSSFFLALTLAKIADIPMQEKNIFVAAILSFLLYLFSDIYTYLSGNLVSEVPAIFLVSTASLALVKALQYRSFTMAVISGGMAFLVYVVRMESLWVLLAFVFALILTIGKIAPQCAWWRGFFTTGIVALFLYFAYAWTFYPLADPRLFIKFSAHLAGVHAVVPAAKLLIVAGGLLWIGVALSFRALRNIPLVRLALAWLFFSILPWFPAIIYSIPGETRMISLIVVPLLLASTLGWAIFLTKRLTEGIIKWSFLAVALAAFIVTMISISNSISYSWMRDLPGMWRLKYIRSFLVVPQFERVKYPVNELLEISNLIYQGNAPTFLVWSRSMRSGYMNIIRYFGPTYPKEADLVMLADPTKIASCDRKRPSDLEPVAFCNEMKLDQFLECRDKKFRILLLRPIREVMQPNSLLFSRKETKLLQTQTFVLSSLE